MNKKTVLYGLFCMAILFIGLTTSCKKDPASLVGGDLQPADEEMMAAFSDTAVCLNLIAFSSQEDTVVTSQRTEYALGSYHHDDFGTLTTNLITQVYPEDKFDSVKSIYEIDSVVLRVVARTAYPFKEDMSMSAMTIRIGELRDAVLVDSSSISRKYYNTQDREFFSGNVLSDYTFTPNLRDSVEDELDSTKKVHNPICRFPLDKDYGRRLLEACTDDVTLNSFLEANKGLYFEALPVNGTNTGQILNLSLSESSSRIVVYYKRTADDTVSKVKAFNMTFLGSMTYNVMKYDRSTASPDFVNQLAGDTSLGQKNLYLQSFFSSRLHFEMPNIRALKDAAGGKQIVLNQVCLVMKPKDLGTRFTPPTNLSMGELRNDTIYGILDHETMIGGTYNSSKKEYRFYLTRHVQRLLLDPSAKNPQLTIYSSKRSSLPECATFYGPDALLNGRSRMRLEVVYTVIP